MKSQLIAIPIVLINKIDIALPFKFCQKKMRHVNLFTTFTPGDYF